MKNNLINNDLFNLNSFAFKEHMDNSTPWDAISGLTSFVENLFSTQVIKPNYNKTPNVFIGKGTFIHPTAEITGPAIIGNNCHIGHAAYLRESCIIGDNVHLGHAVEVKHSILLKNSILAHLNYVGDSIVGNGVNISGGTIVANFRLDKKNIFIKSASLVIDTGLQKFGAAIGDNSIIGVNSVLNPGTVLGMSSIVFPLKSISGRHPSGKTFK